MSETQTTAPTPGPWKAVEGGIYGPGDVEIAECQSEDGVEVEDANAAHIVKCVNAHDELVKAAEPIASLVEHFTGDDSDEIAVTAGELRALALALIKAGG